MVSWQWFGLVASARKCFPEWRLSGPLSLACDFLFGGKELGVYDLLLRWILSRGRFVQLLWVNLNVENIFELSVSDGSVETRATAGVACDAQLIHAQQYSVPITIQFEVHELLHLAGAFTFPPKGCTRSTIRAVEHNHCQTTHSMQNR